MDWQQRERSPQMLKKLAILITAAAVSAPAFADRGRAYGHAPRVVVHEKYYVVRRPAPRPVYVVERHNHVNPVAFLAGAIIGAAIVHHATAGY
jgi:hypothetical protein